MSEDLTAELATMVEKLLHELSAEIRHRYDGVLGYPSEKQRFHRDMAIVDEALDLLVRYELRNVPDDRA